MTATPERAPVRAALVQLLREANDTIPPDVEDLTRRVSCAIELAAAAARLDADSGRPYNLPAYLRAGAMELGQRERGRHERV